MSVARIVLAHLLPTPTVILHHLAETGHFPNVWRPKTLNDKILYRKLNDRSATLALLSDKIAVKDYVARTIGAQYVTPTLWYGTSLPEGAETRWPPPIAIKGNYGAGRNIFIREGDSPNWDAIRHKTAVWMKRRYRSDQLETWYERIPPQILVEPLIPSEQPLADFRLLTFSGRVEAIYVHHPGKPTTVTFFDRNWERLDVTYCGYPRFDGTMPRPAHLAEMISAAEKLAGNLAFVRVDFYDLPDGPRFGEMTFSPNAGNGHFTPQAFDRYLGALWTGPLVVAD